MFLGVAYHIEVLLCYEECAWIDGLIHLAAGHIILRGWCETSNNLNDVGNFCTDQKKSRFPNWTKMKQQGDHTKNEKDNKMTLWFELDDTGCGKYS